MKFNLGQLLNVLEVSTKVIIRESSTFFWSLNNDKTIINGKLVGYLTHKETEPYKNYKVIGVKLENGMLYIAIYKEQK